VRERLGMQVATIARLEDLLRYLERQGGGASGADHARVLAYRQRYGVA
jgi:orotate phosphoribosyltransferase